MKRLRKKSGEKSCLFVSDRRLFQSQSEYVISWHFLFINLSNKESFLYLLYCIVMLYWICSFCLETLRRFLHVMKQIFLIHCFGRGKNVDYYFKASRLFSKFLNFPPKLRAGALATTLLKKMCTLLYLL